MSPLSLYIHWPFCISKCPYCDFNSHVRNSVDHTFWKETLLKEMETFAAKIGPRSLKSIFFGGGTPSLMEPKTVAALIKKSNELWPHESDIEITLEANPNSVEVEKFKAFKEAGVNRVSIGIQALNDPDLKALGRKHSATEALKALEVARENFPRFSFDLIYARSGQTLKDWEKELQEALTLANGHLSLYQLTIEKNTAFYTLHQRGELVLPEDSLATDLFYMTNDLLEKAGLPAYETSNHAKPGQESRHNIAYWAYDEYLGIGPGAHSRVTFDGTFSAIRTHRAPEPWLELVNKKGTGIQENTPLSPQEISTEILLMGLRLKTGISKEKFFSLTHKPLDTFLDPQKKEHLLQEKLLEETKTHLKATPEGSYCLNSILKYLIA